MEILKSKKVWIPLVLVFVMAAVFFGATRYASASALEEGKEAAKQFVPANAELVSTEENTNEYEFEFFDAALGQRYEVEVNKTTKKVKKVESDLVDDRGAKTVTLSEADVTALVEQQYAGAKVETVRLSMEDGLYVYDVTFEANDCYGSLELHAESGVSLESKIRFGTPIVIPTVEDGTTAPEETTYLTLDQAKAILLGEVPGGTVTDIDLERRAGGFVYEAEVHLGGVEHEFTLDAATGAVRSHTQEQEQRVKPTQEPGATPTPASDPLAATDPGTPAQDPAATQAPAVQYIGEAKAKSIALNKANASGATVRSIRLEREGSRMVYDGKIIAGQYAYEFEIDAYTGAILDWDVERAEADDRDDDDDHDDDDDDDDDRDDDDDDDHDDDD